MSKGLAGDGRLAIVMTAATALGAGCVKAEAIRRPVSPGAVAHINDLGREHPPIELVYAAGAAPAGGAPKAVSQLKGADSKEVDVVDLKSERLSIAASQLRGVQVTNRPLGFVQGLMVGALAGALVGVGIGIAGDGGIVLSDREMMVIGGTVFGVLGGLAGGALGALVGQKTVFTFE